MSQTWLGFTKVGNSGRGLGKNFAVALYRNLARLFSDFGKEQITKGSHLEKLCLIEEGVGRDSISDFTTNLIKEFLLDYTQDFTRRLIPNTKRREFTVPKVRFNYQTETWENDRYLLPVFQDDYVLLTPRNMLTRDDTWINRHEFVVDFQAVPESIPDAELRAQVDNYFKKLLSKNPTEAERQDAALRTIYQFPSLVGYYIKEKEDRGDHAASISTSRVQASEQLFLNQFVRLASLLREESAFYETEGNTCDEARQRVHFLKDVIENKGGHKLFYVNGEPIQREEDIHVAYRLTWFGTVSDVSREVNDGRGPADFKISRGHKDKTLVEFKLASNSQLKKNLKHQTQIYQRAGDAHCSIKVILFFTERELKRVQAVLKDLNLTNDNDVVLIDARKSNKPSGSKAA